MKELTTIRGIITHKKPDLDAALSVLLMKKYGREKYPGVETAPVMFVSANTLPGNKTPGQLFREGYLVLDTGGGRFDTHPTVQNENTAKREKSAGSLVAEDLGLIEDPTWKLIIEYVRLQDTLGHAIYSKNHLHLLFSMNTVVAGLNYVEPESENMLKDEMEILEVVSYCPVEKAGETETLRKLVEEYFSILENKCLLESAPMENIRKWISILNEDPASTFPENELDRVISMSRIINGAYIKYGGDYLKTKELFSLCMKVIIRREEEWHKAISEFIEKAKIIKINNLNIVSLESENGLTIKASRFNIRCDIFIYKNPVNGAVTIFIQRHGPLKNFKINKLVGLIRYIEAKISGHKIVFENLMLTGMHCGWFLHQSSNLLIKGSDKACDFEKTQIPLNDLQSIICYFMDQKKNYNLPENYLRYILEYENPAFRK